jgi:fimbrial chaperone protein
VPPLFTLQPGEEQLVRIGMLEEVDKGKESTYRLFITEIASPQPSETVPSGVSMRLQIGVPVFVAPKALPYSTFDLVESNTVDGKLFLKFRNSGNTHVKVSEVQYQPPGTGDSVATPTATYVLAGQTGYLPVPSPDGHAVGKVTVVTDSLGTLEYELPGSP